MCCVFGNHGNIFINICFFLFEINMSIYEGILGLEIPTTQPHLKSGDPSTYSKFETV